MKVYEITIKPLTGFGTPLKSDTIFGHFCWQIVYDNKLLGKTLEELLSNYSKKPFIIFSSAFPKYRGTKCYYAMKAPALPLYEIFDIQSEKREIIKERKEYKSKKWMIIEEGQSFSSFKELKFLNDEELFKELKSKDNMSEETRRQIRRSGTKNYISSFSQPRNTINRITGTTGEGNFAPFNIEQNVFCLETELALFVGIDEDIINVEQVRKGLERIGEFGFGKDASTGLGRFELTEETGIDLSRIGSSSPNACYTLSLSVPEKNTFEKAFFTPFARFGKHGDVLAKSANPFKSPVIMTDEGGIFKPKNRDIFKKPYIGTAVTNVSKAEPNTVIQGYSLYIPVKVEV